MTVDILLATYNGERFLSEQLESIFSQTFRDWRLIVRDDGSTDATTHMLCELESKNPARVKVLPMNEAAQGACDNFSALLRHAAAPYIMFCDQDDVWLPDKIEVTMSAMKSLERQHGVDVPLLVHTDLKVVDEELNVLGDSLWAYQQTSPKHTSLNRLLMQNNATGCTIMINSALRELAQPIPKEARMHDWWLILVAGTFGKIGYVSEATILYRQHGRNDSGAMHWNAWHEIRGFFNKQHRAHAVARRNAIVANLQQQAKVFLERFRSRLGPNERQMLVVFSGLSEQSFFARRYYILKYRFLYANFIANIGMLLFR